MDRTKIGDKEYHKHLGITLQQNGKWNVHIEDTVIRAQKRVDNLRSRMHRLYR